MAKKKSSAVEATAAPVAPIRKAAKKRVTFECIAQVGQVVSLAGSFNDWDPKAKCLSDKKGDGVFTCTVMLEPGTYEYKFVVDGKWQLDDRNPEFAPNDLGTLNSVKVVE
ncbi:MAG: glycogen-binding domain-containing protein [Victivallaceae bacterium]|nr:glycogen-binding domain-containing protein [Victivallaceae bacterium]